MTLFSYGGYNLSVYKAGVREEGQERGHTHLGNKIELTKSQAIALFSCGDKWLFFHVNG